MMYIYSKHLCPQCHHLLPKVDEAEHFRKPAFAIKSSAWSQEIHIEDISTPQTGYFWGLIGCVRFLLSGIYPLEMCPK